MKPPSILPAAALLVLAGSHVPVASADSLDFFNDVVQLASVNIVCTAACVTETIADLGCPLLGDGCICSKFNPNSPPTSASMCAALGCPSEFLGTIFVEAFNTTCADLGA